MKVYIAGLCGEGQTYCHDIIFSTPFNMLESFFMVKPWQSEWIKTENNAGFMLDSGAFTCMNQGRIRMENIDEYITRYANFINKNNIDLFFEFDIDSFVSLKEVERIRDKIEQATKKKTIPV
jgi:hypothetical protein